LPRIDFVGALNNLALGCLPEDLGKFRDRNGATRDDVGKGLAGADRRQLVDVADEEHGAMIRDGLQERVH